jgi:hypothetical protein
MLAWGYVTTTIVSTLLFSSQALAQVSSGQAPVHLPNERRVLPEGQAPQPRVGTDGRSRRVFFYRPGAKNGVAYDTLEKCGEAYDRAGKVGVCVMK